MAWIDDVVKIRDVGVEREFDMGRANLDILDEAESYDEYALRCAVLGIETIFTREDFNRIASEQERGWRKFGR